MPAKADQRIQDALDGTAEENHSGHPTVVRRIPYGRIFWEQVKRNGIDYIALYDVNEKGKRVQILGAELAWVQ